MDRRRNGEHEVPVALHADFEARITSSIPTVRISRMRGAVLVRRCLMYYYGDETEIDLDGHGEREFSDWCWMPLEELPEEVLSLCIPLTLLYLSANYGFVPPWWK